MKHYYVKLKSSSNIGFVYEIDEFLKEIDIILFQCFYAYRDGGIMRIYNIDRKHAVMITDLIDITI